MFRFISGRDLEACRYSALQNKGPTIQTQAPVGACIYKLTLIVVRPPAPAVLPLSCNQTFTGGGKRVEHMRLLRLDGSASMFQLTIARACVHHHFFTFSIYLIFIVNLLSPSVRPSCACE